MCLEIRCPRWERDDEEWWHPSLPSVQPASCAARLQNQNLGAVLTRSVGLKQHWFMSVCVIPPCLGCVSGSVYRWYLALRPQFGPSCSGLVCGCDVIGGSWFSTADSGSDTPADVLWPSAAPLSCSPDIFHSEYTLKQHAADFILEVFKIMTTKEKIYNNLFYIVSKFTGGMFT